MIIYSRYSCKVNYYNEDYSLWGLCAIFSAYYTGMGLLLKVVDILNSDTSKTDQIQFKKIF